MNLCFEGLKVIGLRKDEDKKRNPVGRIMYKQLVRGSYSGLQHKKFLRKLFVGKISRSPKFEVLKKVSTFY